MPSVADDHGERLLKLEENVADIKTSSALTAQSLGHLVEKIDNGFAAVKTQLEAGSKRFERIEDKNDAQEKSITKLEAAEKIRLSRWNTAKKAVLPLLAAAAGAVATGGGEAIWMFLKHLLGG